MGAALAAVVGVCLVGGGVHLLTQEPAVHAEQFGPTRPPPTTPPPDTSGPAASPAPSADPEPSKPAVAAPDWSAADDDVPVPYPPAQVAFEGTEVSADVVAVGVLPSGALQIPDDPAQVGWWAAGAQPGDAEGSVVLAGHMDGLRRDGAMSTLLDVAPGDTVTIEDRRGDTHEYRITTRSTPPQESLDPDLFATDGSPRLVLVTCGGTFDEATGRYSENIVVIAEPVSGDDD